MKINDILALWKTDAIIDEHALDREALKIPDLHHKYLKILLDERIRMKALKIERKRLYGKLCCYYRGELNNPEDLKEIGKQPWPLKVKYQNIDQYIDQDTEYVAINLKVIDLEERVAALEEILQQLRNRGFQLREAIDFVKLKAGF